MGGLLKIILAAIIAVVASLPAHALSTDDGVELLRKLDVEDAAGVRKTCDAIFETLEHLAAHARERPSFSSLVDGLLRSSHRRYIVTYIRAQLGDEARDVESDRMAIEMVLPEMLEDAIEYSKVSLVKRYEVQAKCREELYQALDVINYDRSLSAQDRQTLRELINGESTAFDFDYYIGQAAEKNWTPAQLMEQVRADVAESKALRECYQTIAREGRLPRIGDC